MAYEIFMPKLSSTMDTGTITEWFKNEGDSVAVGEVIFEVMTDKIAIEVEAYEEGILLKRYYDVDDSAPVNSIIGYIGEAGEDVPDAPPGAEPAQVSLASLAPVVAVQAVPVGNPKDVRATPAARKLARERGIDLAAVLGSGKNGRIHAEDVRDLPVSIGIIGSADGPTSIFVTKALTVKPWKGMRKAVADNMVKSKQTAPHVTMHMDVDMTKTTLLRESLLPMIEETSGVRLSYTEIVIMALTKALQRHPEMNAHALEDGIHPYHNVNIGVAVALDDGLVVPVIKNAEMRGLEELTTLVKINAQMARNGNLAELDMSGGTFTISALGKTGVKYFTPVINTPEVGILGVGGIFDSVKIVNGEAVNVKTLPLSLSFDHRAVDGAPAAAFLDTLKALLENPINMLI